MSVIFRLVEDTGCLLNLLPAGEKLTTFVRQPLAEGVMWARRCGLTVDRSPDCAECKFTLLGYGILGALAAQGAEVSSGM